MGGKILGYNRWQVFSISQRQFVVKSLQVVVSLFETTYILSFPGRMPWLKKKLRPILGELPEFWGKLVIFLLPSVNVGSSSPVNGGAKIYFLFLPSVKVGRSPVVKVGDCYLFATFSERW